MLKKLIFSVFLGLLVFSTTYGALSYDANRYLRDRSYVASGNIYLDPIYLNMNEVEGILEGSTSMPMLYFTPTATATASEGMVYYDSDDDTLKYRNASAWVSLAAGTGDNTLDNAYDQGGAGAGKKIDADNGAVEIEVDDGSNNVALHIDHDEATNDNTAVLIENAADAANAISIDIDAQTTGRDVEGTGASWYVTGAGAATFTGLTNTGAAVSLNASSNFATNINTGTSTGTITLGGGSCAGVVDTTGWDIDSTGGFSGLATVVFDSNPTTMTLTSDGAGDDLSLILAGATDSSLVLSSTGTGADALQVTTTAGGIDITSTGAAAGEDIDVSTNSSVNITGQENAADAIVLSASNGGIDILAPSAAAGEDIDITATGSSVNITATEAVTTAIVLNASTAGGGIDITSQEDIDITTTGAAGEDITLTNTGGSVNVTATEDIATAIVINASTGGIDITADGAAASDLDLVCTNGSTNISGGEAIADAVTIAAGAGGVDISAAATFDIDVTATGGKILMNATENAAGSISMTVNGGASETIVMTNTQGTGDDAFNIDATAGGVDLDAAKSIVLTSSENTADSVQLVSSAGGVDITAAGAAGEDLDLVCTSGSANLSGGEDAADAVVVSAGAGGIDISATGEAGQDIDITNTGGSVNVTATEDVANAVYVHANGGTSETIKIHADQGTGAASIELDSDAGGVTVNANGAAGAGLFVCNSALNFGAPQAFGAADSTPDVSGYTYFETGGADTYTDFDAGGGSLTAGTVIIVESEHAATFDVTASGLTGGTTDLVTADGDITVWIYGGADWILVSFTDQSDDLS